MPLHRSWNLTLVLVLLSFAGCTARLARPVPVSHIVMVDRGGAPVDPTGNVLCQSRGDLCDGAHLKSKAYRRLNGQEYDRYLDQLFAALDAFPPDANGRKKVLLYIHGGLNTQFTTIRRAYCAASTVKQNGYFPIYLNWQSNLFTSYANMLYFVRKGSRRPWYGPTTWGFTPFYLARDTSRAVTRAVPIWSFMFANDFRSIRIEEKEKEERIDVYKESGGARLDLRKGVDGRRRPERLLSLGSYALTLPTKLLISPILDAAGTPAWAGMLRAAETAFRTDELPKELTRTAAAGALDPRLEREPTNGGFDIFLVRLKRYIADHGGAQRFEVVLVGHSAGTIVLNHILREAGDAVDSIPFLPVTHVVYMASAATIQDYEDTVFPYLRRHPGVDIHHLVLHHLADARDRVGSILDVPPRGSLLVWIDNFLNERKTYRDRTSGRSDSLSRALDDLDQWQDIVPRIHIREFDVGRAFAATEPQHHRDFGRLSYWNPDCWRTHPEHPEECYDRPLVGPQDRLCRHR